jgi:hypothetical protein
LRGSILQLGSNFLFIMNNPRTSTWRRCKQFWNTHLLVVLVGNVHEVPLMWVLHFPTVHFTTSWNYVDRNSNSVKYLWIH